MKGGQSLTFQSEPKSEPHGKIVAEKTIRHLIDTYYYDIKYVEKQYQL